MNSKTIFASAAGLVLLLAGPLAQADKGQVARSPGKPGAPVAISYQTPQKARVGESLDLGLKVTPSRRVDSLSVQLRTDAGLTLDQPRQEYAFASLKPGQFEQPTLKVIPQGEGRHYVTVTVVAHMGPLKRASVVMIPVQVGNRMQKPAPAGDLQKQADGRVLESLPAEQSVRRNSED